ncbi:unnamed protein product [Malus baccata var. baccata]
MFLSVLVQVKTQIRPIWCFVLKTAQKLKPNFVQFGALCSKLPRNVLNFSFAFFESSLVF